MIKIFKHTKQDKFTVYDKCTSWYLVLFTISLIVALDFDVIHKPYVIVYLSIILLAKYIHIIVLYIVYKGTYLIEFNYSVMYIKKTAKYTKGYVIEYLDYYKYTNGWIVLRGVFYYKDSRSETDFPLKYKKVLRIPNTIKPTSILLANIQASSDLAVKGYFSAVRGETI